jgi:hypothetical protein
MEEKSSRMAKGLVIWNEFLWNVTSTLTQVYFPLEWLAHVELETEVPGLCGRSPTVSAPGREDQKFPFP